MEDVLTKSDLSLAQKNMDAYFNTHDVKYVADDAVFINMGTGERTQGREAIGQMLHQIYHVTFDAHAEIISTIVTEKRAVLEAKFIGMHIGELAGMPPTNKMVNVPLCVTYKLENGLVKEARIYMLGDVLMQQLQS